MNEAYVFQHKYTGLQLFVYHKHSKEHAYDELEDFVLDSEDWVYLGKKVAIGVKQE